MSPSIQNPYSEMYGFNNKEFLEGTEVPRRKEIRNSNTYKFQIRTQ